MRWSNGANVDVQEKECEEEEEKVNSLDALDDHHQGEDEGEEEGRDESNSPVARLDTEGSSISVIDEEVKPSTKKNPASPHRWMAIVNIRRIECRAKVGRYESIRRTYVLDV